MTPEDGKSKFNKLTEKARQAAAEVKKVANEGRKIADAYKKAADAYIAKGRNAAGKIVQTVARASERFDRAIDSIVEGGQAAQDMNKPAQHAPEPRRAGSPRPKRGPFKF